MTAPHRETLHYFNKVDGLKFLDHELEGIPGTRVLPYRVFREPKDFTRGKLPPSPRLLLRSNLEGHTSPAEWNYLPRQDAYPRGKTTKTEIRTGLEEMRGSWKSDVSWLRRERERAEFAMNVERSDPETHLNSLHFIVRPVLRRDEYALYGSAIITAHDAQPTMEIRLRPPNANEITWRQRIHKAGLRHLLHDSLSIPPSQRSEVEPLIHESFPGQRDAILDALQTAIQRVHHRARLTGAVKPGETLELSFAIAKGDPTVEFYDLLRRPLEKRADDPYV